MPARPVPVLIEGHEFDYAACQLLRQLRLYPTKKYAKSGKNMQKINLTGKKERTSTLLVVSRKKFLKGRLSFSAYGVQGMTVFPAGLAGKLLIS